MSTTGRAKAHHKVPRFYLDGFTDPAFGTGAKAKLWVYRFGKPEPYPAKPSKVAFETHFNSLITPTGAPDPAPEEHLSIMDGQLAEIWPSVLHPKHKLTDEERTKLAVFIGFIFTRTSYKRLTTNRVKDKATRMALGVMAAHFDSLDPSLKQGLTKDDLLAASEREGVFKVDHNTHVEGVFEGAFDIAETIYTMKWTFLHVQDDTRLITSDHPLSMLNGEVDETLFGVGLMQKKIEVMLPLDQRCALFMSWEAHEARVPVSGFLAEQSNARTFRWAIDEVYAPCRIHWLDDIVARPRPETEAALGTSTSD